MVLAASCDNIVHLPVASGSLEGCTPSTDLAKNCISASVLSGRLTQYHEVKFDWKLLPPTLEMVCILLSVLH